MSRGSSTGEALLRGILGTWEGSDSYCVPRTNIWIGNCGQSRITSAGIACFGYTLTGNTSVVCPLPLLGSFQAPMNEGGEILTPCPDTDIMSEPCSYENQMGKGPWHVSSRKHLTILSMSSCATQVPSVRKHDRA